MDYVYDYVYLSWSVEVITADHDGYCSGDENYEEIHSAVLWARYWVREKDYNWLKEMSSIPNFFQMFNAPDIVDDLMPVIPNDNVGITGGGSGFCRDSEHGLSHERQRIPIKIVGFALDPPIGPVDILSADSTPLRYHLRHVRNINTTISRVFSVYRFPTEITKMICQHVWNIFQ